MTEPTADLTAFHVGQQATVITALGAFQVGDRQGADPTPYPDDLLALRADDEVTVCAVMDGPTDNLYLWRYTEQAGVQPVTYPGEDGGAVIVRDAYGSWWRLAPAALSPKPLAAADAVYLAAARAYCLSQYDYNAAYNGTAARERRIQADTESTASERWLRAVVDVVTGKIEQP